MKTIIRWIATQIALRFDDMVAGWDHLTSRPDDLRSVDFIYLETGIEDSELEIA